MATRTRHLVGFALPPEMHARMKKVAAYMGISQSELVGRAVQEVLDRNADAIALMEAAVKKLKKGTEAKGEHV